MKFGRLSYNNDDIRKIEWGGGGVHVFKYYFHKRNCVPHLIPKIRVKTQPHPWDNEDIKDARLPCM